MALATKRSARWRTGIWMAAFLLVGFGAARLTAPTPAAAPMAVEAAPSSLMGRSAPTTPFFALDDRTHRLAEVRGKPAIVAVFGHDCAHCHVLLPKAQAFFRKHQAEGLALWAIDGANGTRDDVQSFKRQSGFEAPLFYDPAAGLADALQVDAFPTFYWLDKDGIIRAQVKGEFRDRDFEVLWQLYGRR